MDSKNKSITSVFEGYYKKGNRSGCYYRFRTFALENAGSTTSQSQIRDTIDYYSDLTIKLLNIVDYQWPLYTKWKRREITENETNALRDAFYDLLWKELENERMKFSYLTQG